MNVEQNLYQRLVESSLSRIQKKASDHDYATISAYRSERIVAHPTPEHEEHTNAQNQDAHRILGRQLTDLGYSVTVIDGAWKETDRIDKERSYFVSNHKDDVNFFDNIIQLGIEYEQTVIGLGYANEKFIFYTTHSRYGDSIGHKEIVSSVPFFGSGSDKGDLEKGYGYSKINGRPFALGTPTNELRRWRPNNHIEGMMVMEIRKTDPNYPPMPILTDLERTHTRITFHNEQLKNRFFEKYSNIQYTEVDKHIVFIEDVNILRELPPSARQYIKEVILP